MQFFYIDESEGAGTSKFNDLYLLSAVIAEDAQLRAAEDEMRELAKAVFGKEHNKCEFHGHEIYSGKGIFKGWSPSDRISVVEGIIGVAEKLDLHFGYAVIDKTTYYGNRHPHLLAFLLLVEQIEDRLSRQQSLGVLVADENDQMEERLVLDLELFKTVSTSYGWRPTKIDHIADTVHFVRSKYNRLIQLSDVICSVTLHGISNDSELLEKFLAERNPELKPPKMTWPNWKQNFGSQKQLTNIALWERVQPKCVIRKKFPNS